MKYSQEIYAIKARNKLLKGARRVYRAVSTTLGNKGRNVVIHKNHKTDVIHDGVKVAQEVNPQNEYEAAGAQIIKQAAQKQVETVGDGTSVVIILAYEIARNAQKIINSGVNPMQLRNALEEGRDVIIKKIKQHSNKIETKKQKIQVATIASQSDFLGELIGDVYNKAGSDAVVVAEQITSSETFIDHQEGMQLDSGWKSEYFITNPAQMTATINNAYILVTDYKLNNIYDLQPLLTNVIDENKKINIVIFAEDIEGNVLATMAANKLKGTVQFLAVKAPSYKPEQQLADLAIMVDATFISKDAGIDLKKLTIDSMGRADRVTSSKDATVIIGGKGDKKLIKDRITALKKLRDQEENEFQKEKLTERIAKMTGGVYTIKVGGHTEVEAKDKYERVDDAIKATRAALETGIVPGGEVIYLTALESLNIPKDDMQAYAYKILQEALKSPFRKLVKNAGFDSGEMLAMLKMQMDDKLGIDLNDGEIKNMLEAGIIDPTEVSVEAINNAVSVAGALITSDVIVTEHESEQS